MYVDPTKSEILNHVYLWLNDDIQAVLHRT